MTLYSGIPVSFTKHHVNEYTYSQLSSIFENRFDYYKVFDFIDNYIIDELFPETYKVVINIWTGTYEYFYLKLKDEFNEELLHLKVSPKNEFFNIDIVNTNKEELRINKLYSEYVNKEFTRICKIAQLDKQNQVKVYCMNDSNIESEITLEGTINDIFDEFTNLNNTFKYINSKYYKFIEEKTNNAYLFYVRFVDKNHFLNSAVKHGKLID